MVTAARKDRRKATSALALLALASVVGSANAGSVPGRSWWLKRQDQADSEAAQVLKFISAAGPYATIVGGNTNAIQSAVGMSGDVPTLIASALGSAATDYTSVMSSVTAAKNGTEAIQTPSAIVQTVQSSPIVSGDKIASESLSSSQESSLAADLGEATSSSESQGRVQSWTYDPGAYGCGFSNDAVTDVATATLCSVDASAAPTASSARAEQVLAPVTAFEAVAPAKRSGAIRSVPTPEPQPSRRQYPVDQAGPGDSSSNLFPLFTSYITVDPPTTTHVNFGPTSNLNVSSIPRRGSSDSGNGEAPGNINNPNSPDLGWLDVQVGAVPYKNGDLISSIV